MPFADSALHLKDKSLKTDITKIIENLRQNEEISRKFHEIEVQILTIRNFKDLFEVLLTQIREKFKVPYVWISMIDKSEVSSLIQSLESSDILRERLNIINRDFFYELIENQMTPLLINDRIEQYHRLLPKNQRYLFKSLAVAPISFHGEIIGSLNQADLSKIRFQPGIDTSRLKQLAVIVSLCLSNVFAHEKLRFLATHDPLTGLLNRRVLETVLKREFNRSKRYGGILSLVFLDLDDFKAVNDLYGHDLGDDLLKYVSKTLVEMSRDSDVVARFAGDEFVMILPETSARNAENLTMRIKHYLQDHPLNSEDISIQVPVSFGVASTENIRIKKPSELLKKADEMLYLQKQQKKNSMKFSSLPKD